MEGGCACGEVQYRLRWPPLFVHCCHCLNCQRQTGSAFVINVLIERDRVELLAREPERVPVPRSGTKRQQIYRCPVCETAVWSTYTRTSVLFVRAGTLDDPSVVEPDVHIFTRSRSHGSHCRSRHRRSRPTTTRRSCGRLRASSDSTRSVQAEHAEVPASTTLAAQGLRLPHTDPREVSPRQISG